MPEKILSPLNRRIKRGLDVLLTCCALPFAVPLGLALALFIILDSPGPVIYRQERIGRNGKSFKIYKFRTMAPDADSRLTLFLRANPALDLEWRASHKLKNDPRLTRAGNFLRKTSLDELPQLINILMGEMSLVGPRPIVREEIKKYGKYFSEYCKISPGLTGLWQISGRNNTTYKRRIACDFYYLKKWRPMLDLKILIRTVPIAISGLGAY